MQTVDKLCLHREGLVERDVILSAYVVVELVQYLMAPELLGLRKESSRWFMITERAL